VGASIFHLKQSLGILFDFFQGGLFSMQRRKEALNDHWPLSPNQQNIGQDLFQRNIGAIDAV
jgi:hypothetical protein